MTPSNWKRLKALARKTVEKISTRSIIISPPWMGEAVAGRNRKAPENGYRSGRQRVSLTEGSVEAMRRRERKHREPYRPGW